MQPDEIVDLIIEGDIEILADSLSDLGAADRKRLSQTVGEFALGVDDLGWDHRQKSARAAKAKSRLESSNVDLREFKDRVRRANRAGAIALLACCPASTIKKSSLSLDFLRFGQDDPRFTEVVFQVLKGRDREFNDQLLEAYLKPDSDGDWWLDWLLVNRLIKEEICSKPESDEYLFFMVQSVATTHGHGKVYRGVLEAPGFTESDIYRTFDYDTDAIAYHWKSWRRLIQRLIDEGHVDRDRIVRCAVRSLSNRFRQTSLQGLQKFLDSFEIDSKEWQVYSEDLLGLLRSPVVASYALKRIKELNREGLIEADRLLEGLPAVFQLPTKGSAKTALTMIQQTARKHPGKVPLAIDAVLPALDHPDGDVNEKALELLQQWADRAHVDHATAIRSRVDSLPPLVASRAAEVANQIAGAEGPRTSEDSSADAAEDRGKLLDAANEIDERWRSLAGIDAFLSAWESPVFPAPLSFTRKQVPVLSALQPIAPIQDHAELIDAIAHALEVVDDPMDVERILDGVSRLGLIPDDLDEAARPVAKRLHAQPAGYFSRGITTAVDSGNTMLLLELVLKQPQPDGSAYAEFYLKPSEMDIPDGKWLKLRIAELCEMLKAGHVGCLLSAPTHERGWIDPREFASRLTRRLNDQVPVGEVDFLLALLRLAPENRRAALNSLPDQNDDWLRLARLALNCPVEELGDLSDCETGALNAAAHVRTEPLDEETGKQWDLPAKIVRGEPPVRLVSLLPNEEKGVEVRLGRSHPFDSHDILKPLFQVGQPSRGDVFSAWRTQMNAWTSKQSINHYLATAAMKLRDDIDENSKTSEPIQAFMEVLFEPDRIWEEFMHFLAGLGCLARNPDVRTQTLDALIEASVDGRADPEQLGNTITIAVKGRVGSIKRLAEALNELARVSPLHRWFATRSAEPLITGFDKFPTGAAQILEVYLNGLIELGLVASEEVTETLKGIKGSSKSAKTAKSIVALTVLENSPARAEAKALALQARLDRATRWQQAAAPE